jgi:hypothetical protein
MYFNMPFLLGQADGCPFLACPRNGRKKGPPWKFDIYFGSLKLCLRNSVAASARQTLANFVDFVRLIQNQISKGVWGKIRLKNIVGLKKEFSG